LIDLDWAVGDPRFDLAWMLNTLEMGNRADISETLVHSMEARRESAAGGIGFFRLLARLRWLIGCSIHSNGSARTLTADDKSFLRRVLSLIVDETGLDLSWRRMMNECMTAAASPCGMPGLHPFRLRSAAAVHGALFQEGLLGWGA
jgi:hypothetical protein